MTSDSLNLGGIATGARSGYCAWPHAASSRSLVPNCEHGLTLARAVDMIENVTWLPFIFARYAASFGGPAASRKLNDARSRLAHRFTRRLRRMSLTLTGRFRSNQRRIRDLNRVVIRLRSARMPSYAVGLQRIYFLDEVHRRQAPVQGPSTPIRRAGHITLATCLGYAEGLLKVLSSIRCSVTRGRSFRLLAGRRRLQGYLQ